MAQEISRTCLFIFCFHRTNSPNPWCPDLSKDEAVGAAIWQNHVSHFWCVIAMFVFHRVFPKQNRPLPFFPALGFRSLFYIFLKFSKPIETLQMAEQESPKPPKPQRKQPSASSQGATALSSWWVPQDKVSQPELVIEQFNGYEIYDYHNSLTIQWFIYDSHIWLSSTYYHWVLDSSW